MSILNNRERVGSTFQEVTTEGSKPCDLRNLYKILLNMIEIECSREGILEPPSSNIQNIINVGVSRGIFNHDQTALLVIEILSIIEIR